MIPGFFVFPAFSRRVLRVLSRQVLPSNFSRVTLVPDYCVLLRPETRTRKSPVSSSPGAPGGFLLSRLRRPGPLRLRPVSAGPSGGRLFLRPHGASTCPTATSAVVNARPLLGAAPNKGGRDDGNPCFRDPARARSAHPHGSNLRDRASSLGLGPRERARCPPDQGEEPAERVAKNAPCYWVGKGLPEIRLMTGEYKVNAEHLGPRLLPVGPLSLTLPGQKVGPDRKS